MSAKELTPKQFRKMQLAQLDMLIDFDRFEVCIRKSLHGIATCGKEKNVY